MAKHWMVVKFVGENCVEAVPTSWIVGNKCFWPPYPNTNLIRDAIKKQESPDSEKWQLYDVTFFQNNVFDNYKEAERKTKKAKEPTINDLESDNTLPAKRRKIVIQRFTSFSSTEEELPSILPQPPALEKGLIERNKNRETENEEVKYKDEYEVLNKTLDSSKHVEELVVKNIATHGSGSSIQTSGRSINYQIENIRPQNTNVDLSEKELLIKIIKKQNIQNGLLSSINERLQRLENIVSNLNSVAHVNEDINEFESIFQKFDLPIGENQTIQELEDFFSNQEEFNKAVKELSRLGGETVYDFVARVMEKLITNRCASEFSYHGKRGKKAFNKLILDKLIIKSGLMVFKEKTQVEFEKSIMKWLRRAKERKQ